MSRNNSLYIHKTHTYIHIHKRAWLLCKDLVWSPLLLPVGGRQSWCASEGERFVWRWRSIYALPSPPVSSFSILAASAPKTWHHLQYNGPGAQNRPVHPRSHQDDAVKAAIQRMKGSPKHSAPCSWVLRRGPPALSPTPSIPRKERRNLDFKCYRSNNPLFPSMHVGRYTHMHTQLFLSPKSHSRLRKS